MSSAPEQPPVPEAAPSPTAANGEGAAAPEAPASEPRVHLYDAVSTQRERVLKGFDTQREAILKAVADQHQAALAPIHAVQARQAAGTMAGGVDGRVLGPRGSAAPASMAERTHMIAEIAAAIRVLVAEEVRSQLTTLLQDANGRVRPPPTVD
jgi:hypothetical protein